MLVGMRPLARIVLIAATVATSLAANAEQLPPWLSGFSIHGYLNQAYAVSDEHQIFGIPTDGTADYRDLALQLRYDPNQKNNFLVQLRHQRFGRSPQRNDAIELDWAFYQRNVSDRLSFKAGRIPLPLGIFNEAGGAAMTSPFFRPTNEFYDRQYTSKTVDGALGTISIGGRAGWSFDVDAYGGRWVLDQWGRDEHLDARNAAGAQIWANTPWSGVRFGGGAYRCDVERSDYVMVHGSIDADLDRWRLATEYLTGNLDRYGRYSAWYGQVGFQATDKFSVHARKSIARLNAPINGHSVDAAISDGFGLSLNYAVHPAVLFKLEGHSNDGLLREDMPRNLYGAPSETRYFIASVVATFGARRP